MPTTIEKKSKTTLDYTAFLASLHLYTINLKEAACDIDREAYWEHKEKNVSYKLTAESAGIKEDSFDVRSKLEVSMTGGKSKAHVVKIAATFDLHFHAKAIPKAFVDKFCSADVRLIVWPYFREYVSDVSARMYVPPVILPLSNKEE
jgi:preprotein translocase subunit SecB